MKKTVLITALFNLSLIIILLPSCKKDAPIPASQSAGVDTTGAWRSGKIFTIAGSGNPGYSGDGGQATAAELYGPSGVALDANGNIYIADGSNERIRKMNLATGIITTFAGIGTMGFSGDGGPAINAEFNTPSSITFDDSGNVYFSDQANFRIRKINNLGIITTIAGSGIAGKAGDGGPATDAELSPLVNQIALDNKGNIYIAGYRPVVRMVNTSGIITTFAGNGTKGYSGDGGPATSAELYQCRGVAADKAGNVYIADVRACVVRKVNTSGIITTFAGNGTSGYSGDGGAATDAELQGPVGLVFDNKGNLYIDDILYIREVNTNGIISTVAGNGVVGYSGDGEPATNADIAPSPGIAVDTTGNIYMADYTVERVREVYK